MNPRFFISFLIFIFFFSACRFERKESREAISDLNFLDGSFLKLGKKSELLTITKEKIAKAMESEPETRPSEAEIIEQKHTPLPESQPFHDAETMPAEAGDSGF